MVDPVSDRLEMRLNWSVLGGLIAGAILAFGIGARGWADLQAGSEGAWLVTAAGTLMGVAALAIAVRSQLILTPEGFRVRILWSGRLVSWSSVRRFEPDVFPRGLWWLPRERPAMPETPWQWFATMWAQGHRSIPLFGGSRPYLLQTMNAWLEQYAPAGDEPTDQRTITVDDERFLGEDPRLRARLDQLRSRQRAGKTVSPDDLAGLFQDLLQDLSRGSPQGEEPPA